MEKKKRVVPAGYTRKKKGNAYIECEDHYKIVINSKKYGIQYALISKEDYASCKDRTWGINFSKFTHTFYVYNHWKNPVRGSLALHRHIMGADENTIIDHINHETLDNRRENLRIASRTENRVNLNGALSNNKLGVRNIRWCDKKQKYMVRIKQKHIGQFSCLDDAKRAAQEAREKEWPTVYSVSV